RGEYGRGRMLVTAARGCCALEGRTRGDASRRRSATYHGGPGSDGAAPSEAEGAAPHRRDQSLLGPRMRRAIGTWCVVFAVSSSSVAHGQEVGPPLAAEGDEIGRASCRERREMVAWGGT